MFWVVSKNNKKDINHFNAKKKLLYYNIVISHSALDLIMYYILEFTY